MSGPNENKSTGCNAECSQCPSDGCDDDPQALRGWRLVLPAVGTFLVPLLLALTGAAVAGEGGGRQIVGALAGLAVGVAGAITVSKLMQPAGKESS